MTNPRLERKLGARILKTMSEMQGTPRDNIKRFLILKRKLSRAVADYTKYTGRTALDRNVDYGYVIK